MPFASPLVVGGILLGALLWLRTQVDNDTQVEWLNEPGYQYERPAPSKQAMGFHSTSVTA